MASIPFAELHCHTHFSFLDGASAPDDLVERAAELGLRGLAITDHNGLYGAVRFTSAAEAAGVRPIIGIEVELLDPAVPDPGGIALPRRRAWRPGRRKPAPVEEPPRVVEGRPVRPKPERARLPGHREVKKEDHRGIGEAQRGPHLVLLARDARGWRSLCRMASRANLAGTKAVPKFSHELLAANADGLIALSGCRHGEIARRLRAGDREGARRAAEHYARLFGTGASASAASAGFVLELSHHLLPDDDWLASETARLAHELGLPTVVTNDVHYARPDGRELADVLTAIKHGRTLSELADLRRPDGESYLKGGADLLALPPGDAAVEAADPVLARAWREGIANSVDIAEACRVELTFERYRFPGFEVPKGETPFSHLTALCMEGARRRYHPFTPAVMRQLAHELDVIEKTGLAEFFLICWDLMQFAKRQGIPAQGRGSAADSIVAYVLGITRVDPIRHELLFERFINEGRTAYPDVDIDFSSERREEVIQYVYGKYGPEHTGMVCNLVTYRARSAVREVGYALGFPRPLVDRVAKALETYDSVMVRRDLEAEGGFAQFFARPGEDGVASVSRPLASAALAGPGAAAALAQARGLTDAMGQLNHTRGGRIRTSGAGEHGDGRLARVEDVRRDRPDSPSSAAPGPAPASASAPGPALLPAPQPSLAPSDRATHPVDGSQPVRPNPTDARTGVVDRTESGDSAGFDPRATHGVRGSVTPTPPAGLRALRDVKPGTPVPRRPERWLGGDEADRWLREQVGAFAPGGSASMAASASAPPAASRGLPAGVTPPPAGGTPPAGVTPPPAGAPASPTLPERGRRSEPPNSDQLRPGSVGAPDSSIVGVESGDFGPEPAPTTLGERTWGESARPEPERGTWAGAPGSKPSIRGGPGDDKGGPGDTPVSVRWLREGSPARELERGRDERAGQRRRDWRPNPNEVGARAEGWAPYREVVRAQEATKRIHPESGVLMPEPRRFDPADPARQTRSDHDAGASSVARLDPPLPPAGSEPEHRGSVAHLSDWERWLELCARIDGFPRHLSIHSGGMLVTAAPLIDIAPIERATMKDRVVVQYDKRDVETMKLIKLDLLGLGMLAAIDETLGLIQHDCAVCLDLDYIPEEIPEVFAMLQAADTVGVFQVESRAQMQTLPKSRPASLDDLVVEVAIIRPGPIQGNAVHPYLRRKQGLEPVEYLHPSLEPILHDTLGVILYQEQVMKIAIDVAGFTAAGSDAFRRAMGTYRSKREMDRLHDQFVGGCQQIQGMPADDAEELFRRVAAFASFGFAKSHAAAFARTAYESSFLKLFYPAQFTVGLVNAQPMGFYPVEVLINDAKRHGVAVLPVDVNASSYKTTTEWVGRPGWAMAGEAGDDGSHDGDPGEELPDGCGIGARPRPVRSPACLMPTAAAREKWAAESVTGWGVRLGLHLVNGIGEEHEKRLDAELARGPYTSLADVVERTGLPEEVVERLIRAGALDSLGRPRRELLWQLREVAGATKGRVDGKPVRGVAGGKAAGRPMDLRLPPTDAPALPPIGEAERLGDAYAVIGLDARRQAVALFREALDAMGVMTNASLSERRPGPVRIGGLVVTRQHPMTARGTVFLALEDETGMVNVTLWPDTWQKWRSIVRRHALILVEGDLQREGDVVNVIARRVQPLVEAAQAVGGPANPQGVKQLGMAGMRRLG
ncbi:MAG: PHP domain-containing protein [Chloroflexota bacterium]